MFWTTLIGENNRIFNILLRVSPLVLSGHYGAGNVLCGCHYSVLYIDLQPLCNSYNNKTKSPTYSNTHKIIPNKPKRTSRRSLTLKTKKIKRRCTLPMTTKMRLATFGLSPSHLISNVTFRTIRTRNSKFVCDA